MLGGSFWVAFLRNGMGAILMMSVFLLLDCPRLPMRRTVLCYIAAGGGLSVLFSIWYLVDLESFIRFSGPSALLSVGIFCGLLSSETIYLTFYKITLGFYFLALCVFCGVDIARWWFEGNLWVDIAVRLIVAAIILVFIIRKFRQIFLENVDYFRKEMDMFSAFLLIGSVLLAALVAYWPPVHIFSALNIVRLLIILFMAGVMQYLILHLYIHLGKEHSYQEEKQLLEMNERFLRRQLELERGAEEEASRFRHDIRHHCRLIEEYIRDGETEELLKYVKQYGQETEKKKLEPVCGNKAVNSILSVYSRYAREERICVTMEVSIADRLEIRDIDLVAILANILENAIQGCLRTGPQRLIDLRMTQKGHKIVIQCRNTCAALPYFPKEPEGGRGVSSIVKTAARYEGETDFAVENGMFVVRTLLNVPGQADGKEGVRGGKGLKALS